MKAERHLFGSFDGYQTLAASPGVADAEAAELSEFGFGQTSDQATLEGLSRRLCVLGRPLSSGRIALTRVFSGRPDDAGRPTIELRTIILDAAGFESVRHDLRAFFGHPAHWDETGFRDGLVANISRSTTRSTPSRDAWYLVDSWMKLGNRRDLVLRLSDDARSEDAILSAVGAVDARDAANLRWGLFLFSTSAAADVCTLAGSASLSARRQVVDLPLEQDRWRHPHLAAMALRNDPMPSFQRLAQAPINESGVALEVDGTPRRPGRPGSKTPNGQRSRLLMIAGSIGALLIGVIVMLALWPAPKKPMSPTQIAGVMETNQDGERLPESNSNEDRGSAPPVGEDPDPEAESIPVEASSEEDAHASEPTTNVPPEKGALPIGSNGGTSQVNDRDVGKSRRNRLVVEDPLPLEDAMVPEPSNRGDDQEDSKRKPPKLTDAVMEEIRALIAELKDANGKLREQISKASEKSPQTAPKGPVAPSGKVTKDEKDALESRKQKATTEAKEKREKIRALVRDIKNKASLLGEKSLEAWTDGVGCRLPGIDSGLWVYGVQPLLEENPLKNPTSQSEFVALLASKIPSADVACLRRLVEQLTERNKLLKEISQQFSMADRQVGDLRKLLKEADKRSGFELPLANQLKSLSEDVPGFQAVNTDTLPAWMNTWRRIWNQVLKKKESQSQSGGN